jgi:anti-sigma factor RsiW
MHMTTEDLELYVLGRLTEDRASVVARHLVECGSCGQLLDETREFVQQLRRLNERTSRDANWQERRRHPRLPTDDPAKLRVLQPVNLQTEDVQILDTSREGLRLRVPRALEAGALVQIRMKSLVVLAEVRHCRRVGEVYHAGVAIQDTFPSGSSE